MSCLSQPHQPMLKSGNPAKTLIHTGWPLTINFVAFKFLLFMFEGLQKKWKVGRWRLFLILVIFAGAGSLTGYAGRKLMSHTGIENGFAYILLYLLLITLLWPAFVIALSLPFGQFAFFRAYLLKIIQRMNGNRKDNHDMETGEAPGTGKSFLNPHPKRIVIFV